MCSRSVCRFAAGALVVAVAAGGMLLLNGVAGAAPPAGTLGTLSFNPPTGSDTQIIDVVTSRGCDTPAGVTGAAKMDVTGPVGAANPTFPADNPFPITTAENNTFSTTDPFDIPEGSHLRSAAEQRGKVLQAGEYDFTVTCVDQDFLTPFGTFTGAIVLSIDATTGAVTYTASNGGGDGGSATTTTTPPTSTTTATTSTTTATSSSTASPSMTASSTTEPSEISTPATTTSDPGGRGTPADPGGETHPLAATGGLANTGAPFMFMFLGGSILLMAGLVLVAWLQRPTTATLNDGDDPGGEQQISVPDQQ